MKVRRSDFSRAETAVEPFEEERVAFPSSLFSCGWRFFLLDDGFRFWVEIVAKTTAFRWPESGGTDGGRA